ncbi:hypothetical protein ACJ41O_010028 [Fusarium nematophilum]
MAPAARTALDTIWVAVGTKAPGWRRTCLILKEARSGTEEDDDEVGLRRRKRKRMIQSASNSIRECESSSDGEAELALPKPGRRMAVIDRQQRNVDNEDLDSLSQDSDSEWDTRLPQPKRRKLGSPLPTDCTATRATSRHASSESAGTGLQQVFSPPSSQGRSDTAPSLTGFNERRIENAVLSWRETDDCPSELPS